MGRAVNGPSAGIETVVERSTQPDIVADRFEERHCVGIAVGEATECFELGGELGNSDLVAVLVEPARQCLQPAGASLFSDPADQALTDPPGRSAHRGLQSVARKGVLRSDREVQPGQCAGDSGPFHETRPDRTVGGDSVLFEQDHRAQQSCVHPGQHGNVGGRHVAVEKGRDPVDRCFQGVIAQRDLDLVVERGAPGARPDGLVDPTPVVREQRGRGFDHAAPAAIVHLQVMGGRTRKQVGEVDQPGWRGSGVAVDGLVVVTDSEDVRRRTGKQADQQDVGGCQVLKLVYEQHTAGASGGRPRSGISAQHLDCSQDLLVEVDDPGLTETSTVLRQSIGEAADVAAELLFNRTRWTQPHACGGESLDPDRQGIGHGYAAPADETVEHLPHFGFVDHSGSIASDRLAERPRAPQNRQRQTVESADFQACQVCCPLLHLFAGAHVVGDEADARRVDAAVPNQVPGPFCEHPGLARSGGSDDPGTSTAVCDRAQLIVGEVGARCGVANGCDRTDAEMHRWNHRRFEVAVVEPVQRPSVTPSWPSAGLYVSRTLGQRSGARADGQRNRTDRRLVGFSGVDCVAEHQMLQCLALEVGVG